MDKWQNERRIRAVQERISKIIGIDLTDPANLMTYEELAGYSEKREKTSHAEHAHPDSRDRIEK